MEAILRGSLPLGGLARRVSLDGNPSGMAAQVAVGKLMAGAGGLSSNGLGAAGLWGGGGRARAVLCKRAPSLAKCTVVPRRGLGRLVQY